MKCLQRLCCDGSTVCPRPVSRLYTRDKVQKFSTSENSPIDKCDDICLMCQHGQVQSDEGIFQVTFRLQTLKSLLINTASH